MVAATLHQPALATRHLSESEVLTRTKLGNVALLASDVDRGIFEGYLTDGLLRAQRRLTLYESPNDHTLGLSRFAFEGRRIGQLDLDRFHPAAAARLRAGSSLSLVSVARALGADRGNGHSYFRGSPWVSADMLTLLRYDRSPAERGRELRPDAPVWRFPDDYVDRLRATLKQAGVALDSPR